MWSTILLLATVLPTAAVLMFLLARAGLGYMYTHVILHPTDRQRAAMMRSLSFYPGIILGFLTAIILHHVEVGIGVGVLTIVAYYLALNSIRPAAAR